MNYITIENKKYIIGDIVLTEAPIYSKGSRSARDLIKKKGIENDKFIYARKVGDKLVVSDGKSAKMDKVFFTKEFIISVPELNKENNEKITDDSGVMKVPNIIYLKDEEKFKDDNGKVVEIETRGERVKDLIIEVLKKDLRIKELELMLKNNISYK
jgi:hypothetical protein